MASSLHGNNYEFTCQSANGYDILYAFLQASLDPERILDDHHDDSHYQSAGSSVTSCLDIDALQAQHLEGRAAAETWSEKLTRRVGHVLGNMAELSGAFCDGVACCPAAEEQRVPPSSYRAAAALEIDDNTTECSKTKSSPVLTTRRSKRSSSTSSRPVLQQLPSGLSVEPDPEAAPSTSM